MAKTKFVCHATITLYDSGLAAMTTARPNIVVVAKDRGEAELIAREVLIERYEHPLAKVIDAIIDHVSEIGPAPEAEGW